MFGNKFFLSSAGLSLILIGFSYGINSQSFLGTAIQLPQLTTDLSHIFRGIMGLYFAIGLYWIWAAQIPRHHRGALISLIAVMLGLFSGRMLSFVLDGRASPLLMVYAAMEIVVACVGIFLLKKHA